MTAASTSTNLHFESGAVSIPHPEKTFKGGEDAYFIRDRDGDGKLAFGVADGVGGWTASGVDPAIFAQRLMQFCGDAAENQSCPVKVLRSGLDRVLGMYTRGSSTALICIVKEGKLEMANVGDSGLMVLRRKSENGALDTVFRSDDQLHGFNFPFQLGSASSDSPEGALRASLGLISGDVVIAASDGLFDNLFDEEIVEFVEENLTGNMRDEAELLAKGLGQLAYQRSLSLTEATPFSKKAAEINRLYQGGKSDDITILVFIVKELPEQEPAA
jgi:protein phosphatase PTC7